MLRRSGSAYNGLGFISCDLGSRLARKDSDFAFAHRGRVMCGEELLRGRSQTDR